MVNSNESMRGLGFFIADIRNCRSKEEETKRVNKELAKIRHKFTDAKSLIPYQKRKYICKLIFIFLLGYDVDFGYLEAVSLILSNKAIDKLIASLFLSIMTGPEHSSQKIIRNSLMQELRSNDSLARSMALQSLTNMAFPENAQEFFPVVLDILVSPGSDDSNKESACICLLALLRALNKDADSLIENEKLKDQIGQLLNHSNPSLVSSAVSLLTYLSQSDPTSYRKIIPLAVNIMARILDSVPGGHATDQNYHQVNAPFLMVKLLSLLQTQPGDVIVRSCGSELKYAMGKINDQTLSQRSKKSQYMNAKHAIFFEGVNLAIHCGMIDTCLLFLPHIMELLTWDQANYRHCSMLTLISMTSIPQVFDQIKSSQRAVIDLLKTEPDNNVKRTAISLLCAMCTTKDVVTIVGELIDYLKIASYDLKEDLALKIPLLCGQFISKSKWYVETILSLMVTDGGMISDEICNRVITVIMSKPDVQVHTVNILFKALCDDSCFSDNLLRVSSFVFGEYSNLSSIEPHQLLTCLHSKFFICSYRTQYLMLSAYAKMCNLFPPLTNEIINILTDKSIWCSSDVELQTRAVEYYNIIKSRTLMGDVFDEMPPFTIPDDDVASFGHPSLPEDNPESNEVSLFDISSSSFPEFSEETMDPLSLKKQFLTTDSGLIHDGRDLSVNLQILPGQQNSSISVVISVASKGSAINQPSLIILHNDQNTLRIEITSTPSSIPAWGQGNFTLQISCLSVFTCLPTVTLDYQCNSTNFTVPLTLPITVSKFIQTNEVNSTLFTQRWIKLSDSSQLQTMLMTNSTGFLLFTELGKMGINYLPRIDPNQSNFVGSFIFYCSTPLGVLMRIEFLDNNARITMRMTTPDQELFNELNSLIESL